MGRGRPLWFLARAINQLIIAGFSRDEAWALTPRQIAAHQILTQDERKSDMLMMRAAMWADAKVIDAVLNDG